MKKRIQKIFKIVFPFLLGGGIMYWMYRGFPFSEIRSVLFQMHWEWMLLSFIPGILAQVFRGLRWKQTLEPMAEYPSTKNCILSIFVSYAASLVIPRSGEFLRCGILAKHDGTSFTKALGTVVTERCIDTLVMLLIVCTVFFMQINVFLHFFDITGLRFGHFFSNFTQTGIFVTVLCCICIIVLIYILFRQLSFMRRVKSAMYGMLQGTLSIKHVRNLPLYILYSLGIWVSYFFHYYLTFFCFDFSKDLGLMAALVSFCVGTIAVIVPTPNGAGPWHFAVKTILVLYGLTAAQAITYALIVHSIQTLLLVVLGVYALFRLSWSKSHIVSVRKQS